MASQDTAISVCIPRVHNSWANREKIKKVFDNLKLGVIERIDLPRSKNPHFRTAFIHFTQWNPERMEYYNAFMEGKEIKITYDKHWHWKVSQSRIPKPDFQSSPTIVISGTPPPSAKKSTNKRITHEECTQLM